MEKVTYNVMTAIEFNKLVLNVFKIKYDFNSDWESALEAYYEFDAEKDLSSMHHTELNSWLENTIGNFNAHVILNELCNRAYIEPGKYLIKSES